jgi:hypothetical protein
MNMRARKLKITLSFCALVLLGLNARADTEDWYTFWSFGFANHQYAEPFESAMDRLEALPGVSRTEIAIDMLGFYWPVGDQSKTIAGFVINGSADRLNDSIWTPPRLQVIGLWQLARLQTYIRPLQVAYDDAGP